MKKMGKKFLSAIMALTMVVTILPSFAVFADTSVHWTAVASSDFSQATLGSGSTGKRSGETVYNVTAPAYVSGSNTISWVADAWNGNGAVSKQSGGIYVPDGFMRMSNYGNGSETPLTNATSFKIDVGFRYTGATIDNTQSSTNVTSDKNYTFLKLQTYTGWYDDHNSSMDGYCTFSQDAHGRCYSWSNTAYGTGSNDNAIAMSNSKLSYNTSYHYVVEYVQNTMCRSYVTDNNGVVLWEVFRTTDSTFLGNLNRGLNTYGGDNGGQNNGVTGVKLGSSTGTDMYMRDVQYENITFYTGEKVSQDDSTSNSKYLLTYFTGNNAEGEQLRFAVSTDGLNYKPLNNAMPIWTGANQSITSYPSGGEQGIAVSKHIRDPYIFKGANGKYYVLATDLDTSVAFSNNSKMLVWELDNISDILSNFSHNQSPRGGGKPLSTGVLCRIGVCFISRIFLNITKVFQLRGSGGLCSF